MHRKARFPWLFCSALAFAALGHMQGQGMPAKLPAMYFSDSSKLGRPFAKDPSVIHFKDAYYLYFSQARHRTDNDPAAIREQGFGGVGSIGIARSTDRVHWQLVGEMLPTQPVEALGIGAPGARVIRGEVHLFYQTGATQPTDAICHAVSADGVHFSKDASNPVYHPTQMKWSVGRAIDAEVLIHGSELWMYFATRDPRFKRQLVGMARAPLSSDFSHGTWHDVSIDRPILSPDLPWEMTCIEAPTLAEHNGLLYLFYAGAYNNSPQQIGVATSKDGVHWTRISDKPLLANGAVGTWNATESGHPGILQDDDGQTYLYYQGSADKGKTYYLSMLKVEWSGKVPVLVEPK